MDGTHRLSCEEAFRIIDRYLDGDLPPHEGLSMREHLRDCAGCAAETEFERSLITGIRRKLREVEIPTDLRRRILHLIHQAAPA